MTDAFRQRVGNPRGRYPAKFQLDAANRTTYDALSETRNQLLRVEFPFRHPGARPVYQTAAATIARRAARFR